jgi:hypothetical protein
MASLMSRLPQPRRSPLDEPLNADYAWARYFLLMRWMGVVTALVMIAAAVYLYQVVGFVSIHFYAATMLGIGFAMMLMAALMGLVFLSSGTGHDESIDDPLEDGTWLD